VLGDEVIPAGQTPNTDDHEAIFLDDDHILVMAAPHKKDETRLDLFQIDRDSLYNELDTLKSGQAPKLHAIQTITIPHITAEYLGPSFGYTDSIGNTPFTGTGTDTVRSCNLLSDPAVWYSPTNTMYIIRTIG
jgi:hypothetical protein